MTAQPNAAPTPGPWRAKQQRWNHWTIHNQGIKQIATCIAGTSRYQPDIDEVKANVDLIAASWATAAERDRLKAWVDDLQSGMYVNCVYCGHRYGPGETTPVSMADALKEHIEQCPKHPMSGLKVVNEGLVKALEFYAGPEGGAWGEKARAALAEARKP